MSIGVFVFALNSTGESLVADSLNSSYVPRARSVGATPDAGDATMLFYMSEEAQHFRDAYKDKRVPEASRFPRRP